MCWRSYGHCRHVSDTPATRRDLQRLFSPADRTVWVPTLQSFTLEQWIEQYRVLSEKNRALLKGGLHEKQLAEPAVGKPATEHSDGRGGGQTADR
jgi:hypothetical protein